MPITLHGTFYNVEEASLKLGKSKQTVRNMIVDGRIKGAQKFFTNLKGRFSFLIPKSEIEKLEGARKR